MTAEAVAQGALVMACGVAGLLFLRFWMSARDRIFVFFALAFWVLGAHWLLIAVLSVPAETRYYFYLPRLLAFLLILVGIIDKNRSGRPRR